MPCDSASAPGKQPVKQVLYVLLTLLRVKALNIIIIIVVPK